MNRTGLIICVVAILISCDKLKLYEEFVQIPGEVWSNGNIISFDVNINDTSSAYNIYINIRNVNRYEYSNLYLFTTARSPDGNSITDTVEVILANDYGKWLGKGAASVFTTTSPYKSNIRFPVRGIYSFDIEQAMRVQDLKYISDVGLRIERAAVRQK